MDRTRKLARIEFHRTPAELVGAPGAGDEIVEAVLKKAAVALASELVGICQWGVATSAEYASTRVQFGRPIGTFQAIKHKCVDMLLDLEAAKAVAYYAAWTVETDAPDLPVMSSLAKAECSEAALDVGASGAPVPQARTVGSAAVRRSGSSPRACLPASRVLTAPIVSA
jgi:alkylation response protein AidB-like acyl-CoA dehydrogenase